MSLGEVAIDFGKHVGEHIYLHISGLPHLPQFWQEAIAVAASQAGLKVGEQFNVIKLHRLRDEMSLLYYPTFFEDPFPELARSWRIHLTRDGTVFRTYEDSRNPPILHRKELLLAPGDPRATEYAAVTEAAECIGLFEVPSRIGFRDQWYELVAERGYQFVDNQFIPLANAEGEIQGAPEDQSPEIRRHLTALTRSNFSAPVQALSRHGLVDTRTTFFDYGCGRGDDIRGLIANGIDATGWDPHYAAEEPKQIADAVNLGFVINVIEDLTERVEALKGAFACTRGVLAVAAMLSSEARPEGRQFGDGYISSRNTFQKYFTQAQLRDFIEHTLDDSAIACGPGVFFVFRDKDLEQRFLAKRYGSRTRTVLTRGWIRARPHREPRVKIDRALQLFEANRATLDELWLRFLDLGRPPEREELEVETIRQIEDKLGSLSKALRLARHWNDEKEAERARTSRTSDLLVLFALQQFQKRKPYTRLEPRLKRDVRYFFGNYSMAQDAAHQTLFAIGSLDAIDRACRESSDRGYGWLEEGHSLQLHASLLERLPPLLRIYVECATILYGDISEFDLIKIHIRSGKITLMKFDEFQKSPLPRLLQRVKVKLREQHLDVFTYGAEYPSTLLYHKSRYINEEYPRYSEQMKFEESLQVLGIHDLNGFGPPERDFFETLRRARWQIAGFELIRSRTFPNLDEPCGSNLTYRQLIECGETQARTGIKNVPKEPDTYNALHDLATEVLDPIIDYFGMVKLTFGFCSPQLAKEISGRIAPNLDQHASFEKKNGGIPVCNRLGAACDFLVEDENMAEVANWIFDNTPCDRIYIYGSSQPIHVSYSDSPEGQLVEMRPTRGGRLVPRVIRTRKETFPPNIAGDNFDIAKLEFQAKPTLPEFGDQ